MNTLLAYALQAYSFTLNTSGRGLHATCGDLANAIRATYSLDEPRNRAVYDECKANASLLLHRSNAGQSVWQINRKDA